MYCRGGKKKAFKYPLFSFNSNMANLNTVIFLLLICVLNFSCQSDKPRGKLLDDVVNVKAIAPSYLPPYKGVFTDSQEIKIEIEVLNASLFHNNMRNYYGDSAPSQLSVIWKHNLGFGKTQVGKEVKIWKGAGWTGQPLMVKENGKKYLIQGAYDHHLKKIDAETGKLVWQYLFDDVIKGTGSVWINHKARELKDFCIILQGSRAGKSIYSGLTPSYRAVSYFTGEELWRLNSTRTASYSRDVDASALLFHDTAFLGLENGIFTVFDPDPDSAKMKNNILQPQIYKNSDTLYLKKRHKTSWWQFSY
ncbi:hypothetical protein OAK19_00435 [Aureispira]|nr:hypothetical protein [Aureispira sp.]